MKVLKKGTETDWGKEMRCIGTGLGNEAGCGALLLVSPADLESKYLVCFDEGETIYWFVCPECGVSTYVRHDAFKNRS